MERIENIQEKMYDFEVNKRNNLLFYGVKEDRRKTPNDLFSKVTEGLIVVELKLFLYRSDPCCETPSP